MSQIEEVQTKALAIPDQAKLIQVKDTETLTLANSFFLNIRGLRKEIAAVFDPMEEAAKDAKRKAEDSRKAIVMQRDKVEAPLLAAEAYLNGQIVNYKREQDRIRQEEEERLRQIAIKEEMERRKKLEEEKMAQAAALEQAGATEEAEQVMAEAMQEIEAPIIVTAPPPQMPKVTLSGATVREAWAAQVVDLMALVRAVASGAAPIQAISADMTFLNQMARSMKGNLRIPGVKAVSTSSLAATGRR